MKPNLIKNLVALGISLPSVFISAQTKGDIFKDEYSSDTGWASVNSGINIIDGRVNANNVGANFIPHRIYKKLTKSIRYSENWTVETEFSEDTPDSEISAYDLLSLTADETDPQQYCSSLGSGCTSKTSPHNNLVIFVGKAPSGGVSQAHIWAVNVGHSPAIDIKKGVKYFVRMERMGSTLKLSLFSDEARTLHITGSPSILSTTAVFPEFAYIQHGVSTQGGSFRSSSFTLDNTFISSVKQYTNCNVFNDDYSSNSGWASVNSGINIIDGQVNVKSVDANFIPHRIYKKLTKSIRNSENWTVETEFSEDTPDSEISAYDLLSLTADETDPQQYCSSLGSGCTSKTSPHNNLVIFVGKAPSGGVSQAHIWAVNVGHSPAIDIQMGVKYYVRMERMGSTLKLSLFSDEARTLHITGSPSILSTTAVFPEFAYIQHGVSTQGGSFRSSSFTLDNTCINTSIVTDNSEEKSTSEIQILPNPASNVLEIKSEIQIDEVKILNQLGQVVLTSILQKEINLKGIPKGNYLVKLKSGNKWFTEKLIIE